MNPGEPPVVSIEAPSEESNRLWSKALELARELGESTKWTLIGGLMVQLHAFEHQSSSRLTDDIDVLGDSRRRPHITQHIAEVLEGRGGRMKTPPSSNEDGEPAVAVRRPSLLGAILLKARVVAKRRKEKFDSDRQDLVLLLSFVEDPRAMAAEGELKGSEKNGFEP